MYLCDSICVLLNTIWPGHSSCPYPCFISHLQEIARSAGISAMPTFHMYKNGNKVSELVGAHPKKLEDLIKNNI